MSASSPLHLITGKSENPTVLHHWARITALAWSPDSEVDSCNEEVSKTAAAAAKMTADEDVSCSGKSLLIGRADGSVAIFENGSLEELCHVSRESG